MSATLGALVIAISTEFAVLLDGALPRGARGRARAGATRCGAPTASTGAAVLASGATAIAGFAVLALSDVQMLADFGLVTVVDLTVSLLGVLAVLPAVLMLAERRAGPPRRRRRRGGRRSPPSRHERARAAAAARGDVALHLDRRRARRAGARLHHAQHARHREAGLARRAERARSCRRSRSRSRPSEARRRRARSTPSKACKVRGARTSSTRASWPSAARSCSRSSPPAPSAASDQVDVLERVRRRFPDVGFAAVSVRGDRGDVRAARAQARLGDAGRLRPRRRGRPTPTRSAVCPTITFARRGGKVADTSFALLGRGGAGASASRRCGDRAIVGG